MKKFLVIILIFLNCTNGYASFFSDFFGAIFTIITSPILLIATENPTLRKNDPFRKKKWEEKESTRKIVEDFLIAITYEETEMYALQFLKELRDELMEDPINMSSALAIYYPVPRGYPN